uniref:Aspartate/glutamate/uridylate kinase family protein n=1 Tax=Solanum tuberosum TaxID=4113 RepID=M0ZSX9_SOLTU
MEQKKTSKRLRCIVKLGGAAITCKNKLETIDEENLKEVSSQIRQAFVPESTSANVIGMDWSKRSGQSEVPTFINDLCDQPVADSESFIVVHGAGSFGHFQASKSGVHKGGLSRPLVKAGFVATRISVTSLNLEIVRSLARGTHNSFISMPQAS